jgi:large subunit ribosomal protein L18
MSKTRSEGRARRHRRVRIKVHGTPERPRLCVFRSNTNVYAQVVDDNAGHVLAAASSLKMPAAAAPEGASRRIALARAVGELIASRALEKGITKVAFDRGGYRYHGRVAALAEGARKGGLEF